MTTQEKILDFLSLHDECVIATLGETGPEAATVGFSETPKLELTIGTSNKSRKFQNIMQDPQVAVVVGFSGDITVQFEGTARVLGGSELAERQKLHFRKIPGVAHYKDDPDQTYLSITPSWVRYTNYGQDGEPVEELRHFE
jgi:general stress protein 26